MSPLEPRLLLDASGTWIGQDGHDLVGPSSALGGDDVQDIRFAIDGLPTDRAVAFADVQGLGGGSWQYNGPWGPWAAALVRTPGSTTADLLLEPYQVETGRSFAINLRYDDGSTASFWVQGGAADPNLRLPTASVQATWVGQDGQDRVGLGPAVGPDGLVDARLTLGQLSTAVGLESIAVDGPPGASWQFGLNHQGVNNADLVRRADDPSTADLYLEPDRNLAGQTLKVTVVYANGKVDSTSVVAGVTDPRLRATSPAPYQATTLGATSTWLGQDGIDLAGLGDVHVAIDGLSAGRSVASAVLGDGVAGTWTFQADGQPAPYADPFALPLAVRADPSRPGHLDLAFPPIRPEAGTTLTLRLALDDGSTALVNIAGGAADPALRSPVPVGPSVVAHPGDDLQDLARRFGAVRLASGTYDLDRPLILDRPVTIIADPGATLRFTQPDDQDNWSTAIEVRAGRVTLDGFAVRFAGPIRWADGVSYGPAVVGIGAPAVSGDPIAGLTFTRLDLESPPAASSWEEAPRLLRLAGAANGKVVGNTLKGGITEFLGGPWTIAGNTYRGAVPNTYAYGVFAGHATHDLVLTGNRAEPTGASGKTWRFLVLTVSGTNDRVADNVVVGIGPRDDDTVPGDNAAEVILTEAYGLHFEGKPAAISADRRSVQVIDPPGGPARTGSVVAVVSGPNAGQYRRVVQAIGPGTYLLDAPLPAGDFAISIATGFVGETFRNNALDLRGSEVAAGFVLVGDHFGTRVEGNWIVGGGEAIRLTAAPSENPVTWGWSHAPALGVVVAGNTIEDAWRGATVTVEHGPAVKSSKGRVYLTASLAGNSFRWTEAYLAARARAGLAGDPPSLTIGDLGSIDPGELVVRSERNQVRGPAGYLPGATMRVHVGTINGQAFVDTSIDLPDAPPAAPGYLRLIVDDGISPTDRVSTDPRLRFEGAFGAVGYEYRVGNATTYTRVANPAGFRPEGLTPGFNTILVRSIDASGRRGPAAAIAINYVWGGTPTGSWIGQDRHDYVGPSPLAGGADEVQDIHIALGGLRADRTITFIDVQGLGGSQWQYKGPWGPWAAALVRTPGAATGDLYLQPDRVETGRPFAINLRYDDGSTASFWVQGGAASPTLGMNPRTTISIPAVPTPRPIVPIPTPVPSVPVAAPPVSIPVTAPPSVARPTTRSVAPAPAASKVAAVAPAVSSVPTRVGGNAAAGSTSTTLVPSWNRRPFFALFGFPTRTRGRIASVSAMAIRPGVGRGSVRALPTRPARGLARPMLGHR